MLLNTIILFIGLTLCACQSPVKNESLTTNSVVKVEVLKDTIQFPYKHKNLTMGVDTAITVSYGATACTCAQWILIDPAGNIPDNREQIYLEQANKKIIRADAIWDGLHLPLLLQLEGRFYKETSYPQDYYVSKGPGEPARVFRYDKIKILTKYFRAEKNWGVNRP